MSRVRVTIQRKDDEDLVWVGDRDAFSLDLAGPWLILNEKGVVGALKAYPAKSTRLMCVADQVRGVIVRDIEPGEQ